MSDFIVFSVLLIIILRPFITCQLNLGCGLSVRQLIVIIRTHSTCITKKYDDFSTN